MVDKFLPQRNSTMYLSESGAYVRTEDYESLLLKLDAALDKLDRIDDMRIRTDEKFWHATLNQILHGEKKDEEPGRDCYFEKCADSAAPDSNFCEYHQTIGNPP